MSSGKAEAPGPLAHAMRFRHAIWLGCAVVLTAGLVYAAPTLPWREALAALIEANVAWLLAAMAAGLCIFPVQATLWTQLTPRRQHVPWSTMLEISALCAAAKNTLPYSGLPSAIVLLILRGGLSRGAAVSTLALDQLLTGIAKLAVIAAAVMIVPLPSWMRAGTLSLLLLVTAFLVALMGVAHGREWIDRLAVVFVPGRALLLRLASWARHLEPLCSWSRAWPVLMLALSKKAIEIVMVLLVQKACGIPFAPETAVLIVAALSVTTMLPATPANVGVYEATVLLVYQWAGIAPATALAAALLQHAVQLIPILAMGYGVLLARRPRLLRRSA